MINLIRTTKNWLVSIILQLMNGYERLTKKQQTERERERAVTLLLYNNLNNEIRSAFNSIDRNGVQ